jgi:flagella basal body P-ring formation protein FlgA
MTCYSCKDKSGVEHEECVYVSETRPDVAVVAAESKTETTTEKVRKRPLKKATTIKKSAKSLKATKKSKHLAGQLKPSEVKDSQAKRTLKRKVTIKVDDEMDPHKSRSMHYEHHVSHVE